MSAALALAFAGVASRPAGAAPAAPKAAPGAALEATTQLPRGVRPLHDDIALVPDAQNARLSARAAIDLEITAPTSSITLNAADLSFARATLAPKAGAPLNARIAVNGDAQTATFRFARPLARGRYKLGLDYSGVIGSQAVGLFSLDYTVDGNPAGGKRRALFTQFENSDARRMIPSWDEPAFKATFALRATVPAGEMAVSNMPVESRTTLPDGRVEVRFAVVAAHADPAAWEALRRAAQAERSPMFKDTMYGLLAASDDRVLAERALAFDFALANLDAVNQRVDASRSRYLPGLAGNAATPAMMEKVRAYAEAHIAPEARRDAETAIAGINDRLAVRRARLPEIDAWLARHANQGKRGKKTTRRLR